MNSEKECHEGIRLPGEADVFVAFLYSKQCKIEKREETGLELPLSFRFMEGV